MRSTVAIVLAGFALAGCASHGGGSKPQVVSAPGPQQEDAFKQIKSMNGKWSAKGETMTGEITFAVSSHDSIVRETMFPGTPHEMMNVYHLDGPSVVVTHYCAMGNQPFMRAAGGNPHEIAFHLESVGNLTGADEGYMGELTLTFKDKDHATETWRHFEHGKMADKAMVIQLTRVQ
jgi:hypothetical protein